jgi:thioredoxin reductase (NADPH)
MFDIAIIGGGPAGLSAALYALRAGKTVVLFEGEALGGTLSRLEKIENYPGYEQSSAKELSLSMQRQIQKYNPEIVRQFVVKVMKSGEGFSIFTSSNDFSAKKVVYCGGIIKNTIAAAKDYKGGGLSYCATCDGFFYKNKTVAVVGSGYTAEEDVKYLMPLCKKVYLIGKLPQLEVEQFDDTVKEIIGQERVEAIRLKSGKTLDIEGLFIALGTYSADSLFEIDAKKEKIKGLFFAGDATGEFFQVVHACASGAKAATEAIKELNSAE